MKKIIIGACSALALAALAAVPKISAAGGTTLPSNAPRKSIALVHTLKGVSGRVSVGFNYRLTQSENNPYHVGGANIDPSSEITMTANRDTREIVSRMNLNLQNLYFYRVGDYTFTIEEASTNDELNFPHDNVNKYDIYFQVTNKLDANNEPTGELEVTLLDQMYSYKDDAKVPLVANFESVANYSYISLESKVSGAGADANKYFKYKVSFDGLPENSELTINGQDENIEYGGEEFESSNVQTASDGDVYVYLKHGQTVTIGDYASGSVMAREIPQGVSYTIEKLDDDDGYVSSLDNTETTTVSKAIAPVGSDDFASHNTTIAKNGKDATINTGVFVATWPYLLVAALGVSGFIIFRRISRR